MPNLINTTNYSKNPLQDVRAEKARRNFEFFVGYTKPDYIFKWHHKLICSYLQRFQQKEIKNLMIFLPPQHGKSELISRKFPAWMLGKEPSTKMIGTSYSAALSSQFNRDIQRTIDTKEYSLAFPDTFLNKSNIRTVSQGSFLRNSDIFEIVNQTGSYKSVGVGGSLTGSPCDIGIIDDPVKDAIEAYSQTTQQNIWEWYINVFKTRLHNNSQILMTMTRWHEDDLAGKILKSAKETGEEWTVLILPAIKEDNLNPNDPREIGDALWPERHSLNKLLMAKKESIRTFTSLYQQRPAPVEGALIKEKWFGKISRFDFEEKFEKFKPHVNFFIDSAYTEKQKNDPTVILAACFMDKQLYIISIGRKHMEFPELIKYLPAFVNEHRYGTNGRVFIEPKASGLSIKQQLKSETMLNVISAPEPKGDKVTRVNAITPFIESGRVYLVEGIWQDDFIIECKTFPNDKHDDQVDTLVMAINECSKNNQPAFIWE